MRRDSHDQRDRVASTREGMALIPTGMYLLKSKGWQIGPNGDLGDAFDK